MTDKKSLSSLEAVDEYFDMLIKSMFIEMFGNCNNEVEIGKVCSLHARIGWQALTKAEHMENGDYILVTGTDFINGRINWSGCKYVSKERFEMDPNIIIQNGDILVTKDGTIGKVAVVEDLPKPATLNAGIFVVRNTENNLLTEYLQQCLLSSDFQRFIDSVKRGATISHLNQGKFLKYTIPLADLHLQEEFVNFVKQVDKSRNVCKRIFESFDKLVKSRFIEMFGYIESNSKGWKCNRLGDLGTFKTGGTPSSKHEEYYNGSIPFISTPSLGPNYIDETAAKYLITEKAVDSCATALIPSGSLIIGTRINVGQSSINTVPLCTNQDIVSLMNVDEKYNLLFLKHCIDQYIPYLDSQKKGATIKGITTNLLKSIQIPEPPLEQQNQYEAFVQQVDKSRFKSRTASAAYNIQSDQGLV